MTNKESKIRKYIDEKKELQKIVHQIIESPFADNDADCQNLLIFLKKHQYKENKTDIEHFLHLILMISINHYRQPDFFKNIEKILTITMEFYKPFFSDQELFIFFQQSRPILLILLKAQIIKIDKIIYKQLIKFTKSIKNENYNYFYPEIIQFIKSGAFEGVNDQDFPFNINEDTELFETNRQKGENESKLSSIIREDLIDDFIQYTHQTNISLSSSIERSLFETNSMLFEKEPKLIEYAFFFGSIRIIKYLLTKDVEFDSSIWLYAVHSNNAEVISILEEKNVPMYDTTFSETIKCHHNDIANYILENKMNNSNLNDDNIYSIYSSDNYEFFPYEIDNYSTFFDLCKSNNYSDLVDLYLETNKDEIEDFISKEMPLSITKQNKRFYGNKIYSNLINKALDMDRLDIVYYLLKELNEIPSNLFNGTEKLKKIALPPTIQTISDKAFKQCSSLNDIAIPSSVTSIGNESFYLCSKLSSIKIPSSVTLIGSHAFYFCYLQGQLRIPSSVISIGNNAFVGNHIFKIYFDFPSSLTSIGDFSLSNLYASEIELPFSLTIIGRLSLLNCLLLKYISIPSSVQTIGKGAFSSCKELREIIIPSSITTIEDATFANCDSLTQITLPSSLNYFGKGVFSNSTNLERINIIINNDDEIRIQFYEDKYLIFKSNPNNEIFDTLIWAKQSLTTAIIPPFITHIYQNAFDHCSLLTQIEIPSSVISFGDECFSYCSNLTEINIPSSVKSIGNSTFICCTSLTRITIPSSINTIGFTAFSQCSSLAQITFENPSSLTSIGNACFASLTALTRISIPLNVKSIESNLFNNCTSLVEVEIPSSVTEILDYAFDNCSSLTQLLIHSSVVKIGDSAFCDCSSLSQISFENPSSLISIGQKAFMRCSSLLKIEIPSSVNSIGDYAFCQCLQLDQISIPNNIENINSLAIPSNTKITRF